MIEARTILLGFAVSLVAACGLTMSDAERIGDAQQSMQDGDYRAAEVYLKNVLGDDPDNLQVRILLSEVHLGLNDLPSAEKEIQRAADLGAAAEDIRSIQLRILAGKGSYAELFTALESDRSGLTEIDVLRFRGEALLGTRNGSAAEENFREWLVLEPQSEDAIVGYAKARALQGDGDDARESLNLVIEKNPQHVDALLALAILHYGEGAYASAKSAYVRALEFSQPQKNVQRFVFALVGLADTELMMRDIESARTTIGELARYTPSAPHTLLQQARLAQLDKNDLAAQRALQQLVTISPDNVNALVLLGSVQWRLGYFQQAEVCLSRAVSLAPNNLQARKMWALIQLRRTNTTEAIEILQPLLAQESEDAELYGLLAIADLQRGKSQSALDMLLRTAQRYPENLDVKLQLAEGYRVTGDPQKAIDLLAGLGTGSADDFRRQRIIMSSFMDLEQTEYALVMAERILESGTQDGKTLIYIGQMYAEAGRADLGRAVLQDSLTAAPNDIKTLLALAALEEGDRQFDTARERYESVILVDPGNLKATLGLAELASTLGDTALSARYLERARNDHPDEVRVRLTLAISYLRNHKHREARTLARELARIGSDDPLVSQAVGRILLETGALEEAQAQFELANRLAPDSVDILLGLSQSLMAQGNAEVAFQSLQRALTLDPQSVPVNSVMALAEARLGFLDEAVIRTQKLRQQEPQNASAMVAEGEVQAELGNYEQAIAAFQSAGEVGAGERVAIREFEIRLKWQDDQDPTKPLLDWIAEHPGDTKARTKLAQFYGTAGMSGRAVRLYEALLKTDANDPVVLNNLAWEYQKRGDLETALALAIKARDMQPQSGLIVDTLGWVYRGLGDHDRSARLLREAVQLMPQNAEIRYHLAVTLAETGSNKEAANILVEIIDSGLEFASRDAAVELHAEM
jgi:putative PEP-CTERM system TPR-repeat lipoprotein